MAGDLRLEIYAATMGHIVIEFDGQTYLLDRDGNGGNWHLTNSDGNAPEGSGSATHLGPRGWDWTVALGAALKRLGAHWKGAN
jgi:hypothetical protein